MLKKQVDFNTVDRYHFLVMVQTRNPHLAANYCEEKSWIHCF